MTRMVDGIRCEVGGGSRKEKGINPKICLRHCGRGRHPQPDSFVGGYANLDSGTAFAVIPRGSQGPGQMVVWRMYQRHAQMAKRNKYREPNRRQIVLESSIYHTSSGANRCKGEGCKVCDQPQELVSN